MSETRDAVGQVSMNLPIHEDIKLFIDKNIKINGNDHTMSRTISSSRRQHTYMRRMQEEGCWQHRGVAKLQVQSRSTYDQRSFGDWGYEVTAWHEYSMKTKNIIEKEFDVMKQQLKEEQELYKRENELQQEQVQQGAQHA